MTTEINTVPEPGMTNTPHAFEAYTVAPQVEKLLEEHLGDSSKLLMPGNHRESLVKVFPWVTLFFMPLHFALVMLLFGVTALATLFGHFSWGSAVFSAAILACDVIALPGLFKRTRKGWEFFIYAQTLSMVSDLVYFSVFGLVIGLAIFWGAFQVKYKYS